MADARLLYFAYGSNLHPVRLRERIASSRAVSIGRIYGYRLYFHKRGGDGSGKCNIEPSRAPDAAVVGVAYSMLAAEREILDGIEGLGHGYRHIALQVDCPDGPHPAFAYLAEPAFIDERLRPYDWYKALVVEGARAHGLPRAWIESLEAVEAMPDADAQRVAEHRRILGSGLTASLALSG